MKLIKRLRVFYILSLILLICAGELPAQVINYKIDSSFNTYELFSRGFIRDIDIFINDDILINSNMQNFLSPAEALCILDNSGNLELNLNDGAASANEIYLDGILSYGPNGISRNNIPFELNANFRFEFSKDVYMFQGFSQKVNNILILEDSTILVGGRFSTDSVNPGPAGVRHLCRIDSLGVPLADFTLIHCQEPVNSSIFDIIKTSDGGYLVSGDFSKINDVEINCLAKFNSDFTIDTSFSSPFNYGANGARIYLEDSENSVWLLSPPGVNLTEYPDSSTTLVKIDPNGTLDSDFILPEIFTILGNDNYEYEVGPATILEDTDGTFILGGEFLNYNGVTVKHLIKINSNGELIEGAFSNLGADDAQWGNWTSPFGLAGTFIGKILKLSDGKLLLGGQFSSFGGEPYSCMVRLEEDGFVGVNELRPPDIDLKIWPNPASQSLNFHVTEKVERIEIISVNGNLVSYLNRPEQNLISIRNLSSGLYFIKFHTKKGLRVKKLVVE